MSHHLPKRMIAPLLLAILAGAGLTACADTKSAQELAYETLQTVARYEQEVDAKIAAEKTFYRDQLETIRVLIGGVPADDAASKCETATAAQCTWLYGRISTAILRDARIAAADILTEEEPQAIALMISMLDRGIEAETAAIADARARQKELGTALANNLAPLVKQKQRLAELRKGLTRLAAEPSASDRFKLVKSLIEAVAKEIDGDAISGGS